jgi:phenylpropionate dioxygenase-like ring-hydroxylating dioxygenase large terminal subunit
MLPIGFMLYFFYNFLIGSGNSFILQKPKVFRNIERSLVLESNPVNEHTKKEIELLHFGSFPRLDFPNQNGQLTWYPIGFSKDFGIKPTLVTIRDINYIVWRDKSGYYGLRDCCSHQGSSFMLGQTCKNTISCPYHGYIFDGTNGELIQIPQLPHMESHSHNIDYFKVVEKGDMVYFNTIPITNPEMKKKIDESQIFVEPEFFDKDQRVVYLQEDFEHYAKFVSVNSLDICHIGFVHTFGNKKSPNPLHNSKVLKLDDFDHHYKIIYEYLAGENSLVNKIYNYDKIEVENEYVLPHSTVARVKFGNLTSTIITHALPISKFKTKLFVKAYRSYWSFDLANKKNQNILYPLMHLINMTGDKITENTMYHTLKEDKAIVDHIDKSNYQDMHGKFSIAYDLFSNHYKSNYKKFYEDGHLQI